MFVIAKRSLLFRNPKQGQKPVVVPALAEPQEVPDWLKETPEWGFATRGKEPAIIEVVLKKVEAFVAKDAEKSEESSADDSDGKSDEKSEDKSAGKKSSKKS